MPVAGCSDLVDEGGCEGSGSQAAASASASVDGSQVTDHEGAIQQQALLGTEVALADLHKLKTPTRDPIGACTRLCLMACFSACSCSSKHGLAQQLRVVLRTLARLPRSILYKLYMSTTLPWLGSAWQRQLRVWLLRMSPGLVGPAPGARICTITFTLDLAFLL